DCRERSTRKCFRIEVARRRDRSAASCRLTATGRQGLRWAPQARVQLQKFQSSLFTFYERLKFFRRELIRPALSTSCSDCPALYALQLHLRGCAIRRADRSGSPKVDRSRGRM